MVRVVVFDMDGVLVDVRPSYRAAVTKVLEKFLDSKPSPVTEDDIDYLKLSGGFNDDWKLTEYLLRKEGVDITFDEVKQRFEEIFLGSELYQQFYDNTPLYYNEDKGLIDDEIPLVSTEFLDKISGSCLLALATGRNEQECLYTLKKFNYEPYFRTRVTMYEIPEDKRKPHPFSLIEAVRRLNSPDDIEMCYYIGDIPDDIHAANAAKESYPFASVGCLEAVSSRDKTRTSMQDACADYIIERTEELLKVLKL